MAIRNWRQLSSAMQVPMTFVNIAIPTMCAIMILVTLKKMLEPRHQNSEQL
jgi:TRAP-type C4-dicarboxylate transport system permease small subunit